MINTDTARVLLELANEAYFADEPDSVFHGGYTRMDQTWYQIGTRTSWLARNHYMKIENPNGTSDSTRYYGIVAESGPRVIVAFRGTKNWGDAKIDIGGTTLFAGQVVYPFAEWNVSPSEALWVHKNFLGLYQSLQKSIQDAVKILFLSNSSLKELYVTGHSLGGALATLCAIDLSVNLCRTDTRIPNPAVYTFASPLVGDAQLVDLQMRMVPEWYRFEIPNDQVPGMPSRGKTPPFQEWESDGKKGEPPQPAVVPFVAVGERCLLPMTTTRIEGSWQYFFHSLSYYNRCLGQASPLALNGLFKVTDLIEDLAVEITTANEWGAGTNVDVLLTVLGVTWGPLVSDRDDFEAGSSWKYPLFKPFPEKVPPNPLVGDLTNITLSLGRQPSFRDAWHGDWKPSKVELFVNGESFTSFYPSDWLRVWPANLRSWTQLIDLSPAR